jgi:hypothetical protein
VLCAAEKQKQGKDQDQVLRSACCVLRKSKKTGEREEARGKRKEKSKGGDQ